VPVADRPKFLYDRLFKQGATYSSSDFSAFEGLIDPSIFRACEFQLYSYMATNLPVRGELLHHIKRALAGENYCQFRGVVAKVRGCRMSGDMCTSLGNSFTNLMLWLFLANEQQLVVDGVVEGDDGLFVCRDISGNPATISPEQFARLGFRAKLKTSQNIGEAGFCKLFFDEQELENVVEPSYAMCGYGWTHSPLMRGSQETLDALQRAKCDSLLAMYPRCPIITAMAESGLRLLGDGKRLWSGVGGTMDYWETQLFYGINVLNLNKLGVNFVRINKGISYTTRLLYERLFGVSPAVQIEIESYFRGMTKVCPLSHPAIVNMMKEEWKRYYRRFVFHYRRGDPDIFPAG